MVIVLSSKLSPQSVLEEPGDGELTMYGALSTRQETTIWLTFPDANKIIIGQPDLKYHKKERTGSDNQKRSPSNILPSSQINQEQLSIELMKVSAVFLTTLLQYVVTLRLAADLHLLQPL